MRVSPRRWILTCSVAIVFAFGSARGETPARRETDDRPYWRTNLFRRAVADQKFLVVHWWPSEARDPLFLGTLGVGVAVAYDSGRQGGRGRDFDLERDIVTGAGPRAKIASQNLTRLGNAPFLAAALGVTYLASRHGMHDRMARTASLASESLLDAGVWVVTLKSLTARVRPHQSGEGTFLQYGNSQNGSFPSGHAMAAFAVASVFAGEYREKRWVGWLSYGTAAAIGAGRIALGRHFPSDVLVGAVLGTSIGHAVRARAGEEDGTSRFPGSIGPILPPDGRGIGIGWSRTWR